MTYTRETLRVLFRSPFDLAAWQVFLHDFFGAASIKASPQRVAVPPTETAAGVEGFLLGDMATSDGLRVGLFHYRVPAAQVERRRVGLRQLVAPWVKYDYDAALVAFSSAGSPLWRFSLVCDIKGEATSARRFTYVFGDPRTSYRTPVERFLSLSVHSFTAMREAFSVEALSDQFFKEYKEHYEDFVSYVTGKRYVKQAGKWVETEVDSPHRTLYATFDRNDKRVRDYVKKLLGRLVFLHFLQKKGWLGASAGTWADGDRAFLLHIFEKASPDQRDDFLDGVLERLFFNALNTDRSTSGDFFATGVRGIGKCRIPYLNGGLFERDDLDTLRVKFPAEFFDRLLRFFAEYNFTIDENDPDEAEVGIDPEMLGRIFENLLEDNKDKGAFYTPKEIVGYMCRQSLLAYLTEGMSETAAVRIATFLDTRDASPLPPALAGNLAEKLRNVKICDPAIGSGAFPMGLLRELYALRFVLGESGAAIKRSIIENNIYGVDIEKGAVDIARLRFWLSLVVDEDEPSPLPNLDFKIMQGNSLVESWQGHDLSHLVEQKTFGQLILFEDIADVHRKQLRDRLHAWYSCSNHRERTRLRNEIRKTAEGQISSVWPDFTFGDLDPSANSDFFLWHLWFAEVFDKGGFDIVIGNPPYIQLQSDHGKLGDLYKPCGYETFAKTGDIYCLFYERGWQILNEGGHLCYITSNKWMRAGYGEATRKFFAEKTDPQLLIDFAGEKIFESATVDTNILLFEKCRKNRGKTSCCIGTSECRKDLSVFVKRNAINSSFANSESWVILSPIEQSIKRKIEERGIPLKDWGVNIYRGILTGCNEAFIIDETKRQEILGNCLDASERKRTEQLIRPILRGRDIKRYAYEWAHLYIIATFPAKHLDIDDYPAVKRHLLAFGIERLEQTGKEHIINGERIKARKKSSNKWFETQDTIAYMDDFAKPKIVWGNLSLNAAFAKAPAGMFINAPCVMITPFSDDLLAVLNSKLGDWYIRQLGVTRNGGYFEYKPMFVEQLPVPQPLTTVLNDADVCQLFGLNHEEIDFIERV